MTALQDSIDAKSLTCSSVGVPKSTCVHLSQLGECYTVKAILLTEYSVTCTCIQIMYARDIENTR